MKIKPKGRKIYRKKTKYERMLSLRSNTAAVIWTILAVGLLIFVGYSAGGPLIRFLQDSHILAVPNEVEETQPVTEPTTQAASETETAPVSETETQAPTEIKAQAPRLRGCLLETASLVTQSALEQAVASVPEGTTHVLIPLKARGGEIYYATTVADAAQSGAVKAALPLQQIYDTVAAGGYEPVALLDTLEDSIYPRTFPEAAYCYEDGTSWLDAENDGKPALSPLSIVTLDYLSKLTAEIADAGFASFVCDGLVFPDFSEEDLTRLDPQLSDPERYTLLSGVIRTMHDAAPHCELYAVANGSAILNRTDEALEATEEQELTAVILRIDAGSASAADMLLTLPEHHAAILAWDGIPVPDGEKNYIVTYASAVKEDAEQPTETAG